MPRDATTTRTAIMDAAEALILDHGFAGTSIDRVIRKAGITKGTFFYYFGSKADLGLALVQRFADLDRRQLEDNMDRAERLSRDPLQQVLIFIGLFREAADELAEPYPGCLFASYIHEAQLFDDQTLEVIRRAMTAWRDRLGGKLREVMEHYPSRLAVDPDALADMITVLFEGAFILSKTLREPKVIARQLDHYRAYLELLFAPEVGRERPAPGTAG